MRKAKPVIINAKELAEKAKQIFPETKNPFQDWSEFGRLTKTVCYVIGRVMGSDHPDCADVAQDTMFVAFRALKTFDGREPNDFRAYVRVIGRRRALNHLKKVSEKNTIVFSDLPNRQEDSEATDFDIPLKELHKLDRLVLKESLKAAFASLSQREKEVFELRSESNLSFEEIAQHLNSTTTDPTIGKPVTAKAVENTFHRTRSVLKTAIRQNYPAPRKLVA